MTTVTKRSLQQRHTLTQDINADVPRIRFVRSFLSFTHTYTRTQLFLPLETLC